MNLHRRQIGVDQILVRIYDAQEQVYGDVRCCSKCPPYLYVTWIRTVTVRRGLHNLRRLTGRLDG